MPWDYAYRTQTIVEMKTTSYQEYLGDNIDPFPALKYTDGMTMLISAPDFPPAKEAAICSGDISIPFLLRRKPWLEYSELCFGSVSNDCGLDINIVLHKDTEKISFSITKISGIELDIQLQREKLFEAMWQTKQFSLSIDGVKRKPHQIAEDELQKTMFSSAKHMVRYIECLLNIERILQCKFDPDIGNVSWDDYKVALILSDSLEQKWHRFKSAFDNDLRCDYNQLSNDLSDINYKTSGLAIIGNSLHITLHGVIFAVEKFFTLYEGAQLNNIKSVIKNKQNRRKNILMTIRPEKGKEYFFKYCRFEGITIANSNLY